MRESTSWNTLHLRIVDSLQPKSYTSLCRHTFGIACVLTDVLEGVTTEVALEVAAENMIRRASRMRQIPGQVLPVKGQYM